MEINQSHEEVSEIKEVGTKFLYLSYDGLYKAGNYSHDWIFLYHTCDEILESNQLHDEVSEIKEVSTKLVYISVNIDSAG